MLTVVQHPLLSHQLQILRCINTQPEGFRLALTRLATLVLVEATRQLPLSASTVTTPLGTVPSQQLDTSVSVVWVPILRAGLMMCEPALQLVPSARVHHLGFARDETTFAPHAYYNKLAQTGTESLGKSGRFFILDPMLATGGSALLAISALCDAGVALENITLACIIAAPEGVAAIEAQHPTLPIYTAALDAHLTPQAYIYPGLGDAGDRAFNTLAL